MPRSAHRRRKAARSSSGVDPASTIEHTQLAANGSTFSLQTSGPQSGRPILLLHGFPQTASCWRTILTDLGAANFRAIAPNQRGYSPGARPTDVSAYATDNLVADVLAMADALSLERFDLVGHDWGGLVSWIVAARHPERVRSLSVVSTPHPLALRLALSGGDPQQAKRTAPMEPFTRPDRPESLLLGSDGTGSGLRSLLEAGGLPAEVTDTYVKAFTQPGAMKAALNWFRAADSEIAADFPPLMVPTLYVWSTGDTALLRTAAESTALYVNGPYTFVVLDDVSHWIPETAPDQLIEPLLAHLQRT